MKCKVALGKDFLEIPIYMRLFIGWKVELYIYIYICVWKIFIQFPKAK